MRSHIRVRRHSKQIRLRYKRNYMRLWRARPENLKRERRARQRAYVHQKLYREVRQVHRVCGFCHQRAPIETVVRLRPVASGYVERRVPYCGQC